MNKPRIPLLSFSLFTVAAGFCFPAVGYGQDAGAIIFQDDFNTQAIGNAPESPWTNSSFGENSGPLAVIADQSDRFNETSGNQVLEWRKNVAGSAMALQALNVFSGETASEVMTFSFDFLESGSADFARYFSLYVYSGDGTAPANRVQRLLVGKGEIGNAAYVAGRVVRADIVVNNGAAPLVYRDGTQTLSAGFMHIWLDGELAAVEFQRDNNLRGPITGFQLNTSGNDTVLAWFDDVVVRSEPFVRDVPEATSALFVSDFEFQLENAAPAGPWTQVLDGEGRGSMLVMKDAQDLLGSGTDNQILEYKGDGTTSPMNLRAGAVFPAASAPEVGTFSFRMYEPDVEGGKGFISLYVYMEEAIFSANVAHRLIFGRGEMGGFAYEYDTAIQVDYVVNGSAEALEYREGARTLPSGLADVWVNGELVVEGLATSNSNLGGIQSFQIMNNSGDTPLIYIDDIIFRDVPHVTEQAAAGGGYQDWREVYFSETELGDPTISGDEADPDGDGIANLLEYALGSEPREASVEKLPVSAVREVAGEDFLTLEFRKPDGVEGVEYRIEVSGDLTNWNYNGDGTGETYTEIVEEIPGDGSTLVVIRDSSSLSESGRRFIRLQVVGGAEIL